MEEGDKPEGFKYPKFLVFELTEHGPHIWTFETADETTIHIFGGYLPGLALFVNGELYPLKGGEIAKVKEELEKL
jgi:hypothetical protein